ncbi:MAG: type II toxin-antitoxin system RelE/ParE family toxin [Kofleriaceae bacterium]|nr:type II toxin-antitoxin system RelE/ParE family toxin [Kofleriaceae bacterium]
MIQGFGCRATRDLYNGKATARARNLAPPHVLAASLDMLDLMNACVTIEDLRSPPSNHLEQLSGGLSGLHSVRINIRYRIIFRWTDSGPDDIRLDDHTY